MLCAVAVVVLLGMVVDFVARNLYWSTILASLVVAGAAAVGLTVSKQRARERADQAQRGRLIAVTDAISGPEFEQWFARILVPSEFRQVKVCGGYGDRGADVMAIAPDGRRVVVQGKWQSISNRVGGAAIQRFAGTCRDIHGGEICMLVTNSLFTAATASSWPGSSTSRRSTGTHRKCGVVGETHDGGRRGLTPAQHTTSATVPVRRLAYDGQKSEVLLASGQLQRALRPSSSYQLLRKSGFALSSC